MKTKGSNLYYSSLPSNEAPQSVPTTLARRKNVKPPQSPRKTIENASSSVSNAVVTSVNSARKIKDRARPSVPKKVPISKNKKGELDGATPVIFYADEDTVTNGEDDNFITFFDPFSFGDTEGPGNENFFTPSSVVPVRLFSGCNRNGNITSTKSKDNRHAKNDLFKLDEVASFDFDRPSFARDFNFSKEDASFEVSETIKKEDGFESSEALWQDTMLPWDNFQSSPSCTMCEWDPKTNHGTVPSSLTNLHQAK